MGQFENVINFQGSIGKLWGQLVKENKKNSGQFNFFFEN